MKFRFVLASATAFFSHPGDRPSTILSGESGFVEVSFPIPNLSSTIVGESVNNTSTSANPVKK